MRTYYTARWSGLNPLKAVTRLQQSAALKDILRFRQHAVAATWNISNHAALVAKTNYVGNEAAREYLDGCRAGVSHTHMWPRTEQPVEPITHVISDLSHITGTQGTSFPMLTMSFRMSKTRSRIRSRHRDPVDLMCNLGDVVHSLDNVTGVLKQPPPVSQLWLLRSSVTRNCSA